jgi:hypothetical protein
MDNLTLISCSYNTPEVTMGMLKTFTWLHPTHKDILICDNSTNDETEKLLKEAKIPHIRTAGGLHAPSVDILLENCRTKYALLVDTDIIFKAPHDEILQNIIFNNMHITGEHQGDRGGKQLYDRIAPWWCFIDVEEIKKHGIKFFDRERMSKNATSARKYDVGSTFFQDIKNKKLRIGLFNGVGNYYIHYEGMSWHSGKYDPLKPDGDIDLNSSDTHNQRAYYEHGQRVYRNYMFDNSLAMTRLLKPLNEVFIIAHNMNIIKHYEDNNLMANIPKYRYLLVGQHDIEPTDKIIVCCKLPKNIEQHKEYLQFTAWKALVDNNLIETSYATLLEYDVQLKPDLYLKMNQNILKYQNVDCFGFATLPKTNSFLNNDIFSDKLCEFVTRKEQMGLKQYIAKSMAFNPNWIVTSNICINTDVLEDYVESKFFGDLLKHLEGDKYAGHHLERAVTVFLSQCKNNYMTIPDLVRHYAVDSHKTQNYNVDHSYIPKSII